jgi:release factor glutamine methyltransferase
MKNSNYTIENITNLFKKELKPLYPKEDIKGFIRWALGHVTGYTSIEMAMNRNKVISENQTNHLLQIIERLKTYEPIQYVLGETEFYGLKIKVNPNVLIPRPETEELVDWIIKENKNKPVTILDIGMGSGCIAIALKKNLPSAQIIAIDIAEDALIIAKENALLNKVSIEFIKINIFDKSIRNTLPSIDIIVSNPPYITQQEKPFMEKNVLDYEPHLALFVSNENPLLFYKEILDFASERLNKDGLIYWEINESMEGNLKTLLNQYGHHNFEFRKDLRGKERMLKLKK